MGGILKLSDLDSLTIFIWEGILKLLDLDSLTIFIWGGILKLLDLDSLTIFIWGYAETLGFGLSDNFHLGGYSETQNRGILEEFGPKFQPLQQAHASQIVSHILRMWRLTNCCSQVCLEFAENFVTQKFMDLISDTKFVLHFKTGKL